MIASTYAENKCLLHRRISCNEYTVLRLSSAAVDGGFLHSCLPADQSRAAAAAPRRFTRRSRHDPGADRGARRRAAGHLRPARGRPRSHCRHRPLRPLADHWDARCVPGRPGPVTYVEIFRCRFLGHSAAHLARSKRLRVTSVAVGPRGVARTLSFLSISVAFTRAAPGERPIARAARVLLKCLQVLHDSTTNWPSRGGQPLAADP